jgi:hypothetical protein
VKPAGRWWILALSVVAASATVEVLFPDLAHAKFFWHRLPGFDFAYGLAGCAFIVFGAKWLGNRFLYRPETYYEEDAAE